MVMLVYERVGKVIYEKIKMLREQNNMTQAQLAKAIGITRAAVNAYEQAISVPSTQYIIELASTMLILMIA